LSCSTPARHARLDVLDEVAHLEDAGQRLAEAKERHADPLCVRSMMDGGDANRRAERGAFRKLDGKRYGPA
jgi:hypothetical protein